MDQIALASERDSRNVCILCESDKQPRKRGLCGTCYGHFRRERDRMTREQAATFEQRAMAKGYILPVRQGRRPQSQPDPFADLADTVREESPSYAPPADPPAELPNSRPHLGRRHLPHDKEP